MRKSSEELLFLNGQTDTKFSSSTKILSLNFNQDNTLLVAGSNNGYRIYEAKNDFSLISKVNNSQIDLGELQNVKMLYKSSIIIFSGNKNNTSYHPNYLYIYDDSLESTIGTIIFKEKLVDFFISSSLLFVCFYSKILVLEIKNLKFIHSIKHCKFSKELFSLTEDEIIKNEETSSKAITICFIPSYEFKEINNDKKENKHITILRYVIINNMPLYKNEDCLDTKLNSDIDYLKLFPGNKLVVYSSSVQKINFFDYLNKNLKFCIEFGKNIKIINNILLNKKENLLVVIDKTKLNIYNIQNDSNNNNENIINVLSSIETKDFDNTNYICHFSNTSTSEIEVIAKNGVVSKYKIKNGNDEDYDYDYFI